MAITKLQIYQEASLLLGDVRIATLSDGIPLISSLDDEYDRAVQFVLRAAPWKHATKTSSITASGTAISGFTQVISKPSDWRRTLAVFVLSNSVKECPIDCREQDTKIYTRVTPVILRFISNDGATESTWPEQFGKAVAAYLAFRIADRDTGNPDKTKQMFSIWQQTFDNARMVDAIPENPWLQAQFDGSFYRTVRSLLEKGFWRFCMKTVSITAGVATPSSGYGYACAAPADFDRVFHLYRQISSGVGACFEQIDFRYEGGYFHTNYSPIILRYTSTDGENSTTWSDAFTAAVLARVQLEAGGGKSAAELQGLALAAEAALDRARIADDMTERPRVLQTGRLVRARLSGPGGWRSEQALW